MWEQVKQTETDDNEKDYQELDAEMDDEEIIDMIDQIMFKNCTWSFFSLVFFFLFLSFFFRIFQNYSVFFE